MPQWIATGTEAEALVACGDVNASPQKPSAALMATRLRPKQAAPAAFTPRADGAGNVPHPA